MEALGPFKRNSECVETEFVEVETCIAVAKSIPAKEDATAKLDS